VGGLRRAMYSNSHTMSCSEAECTVPDWFHFVKLVVDEKVRVMIEKQVEFDKEELLQHVMLCVRNLLSLSSDQIVSHCYQRFVSLKCLKSGCDNWVVFEVELC